MIKKMFLFLLWMIFAASAALAQSTDKETVKAGVKEVLAEKKANEQLELAGKFGINAQTGFFIADEADLMQMVLMGFEYHVSDTISLKPSIGFKVGNPESKNKMTGSSSSQNNTTIAGVLALHYHFFNPEKNLVPYIGLQAEVIHYEETSQSSGSSSEDREKINYINGFFKIGAKYMINNHFGFFGDVALGVSSMKIKRQTINLSTDTITSDTERTDFMIISRKAFVGAVFYF